MGIYTILGTEVIGCKNPPDIYIQQFYERFSTKKSHELNKTPRKQLKLNDETVKKVNDKHVSGLNPEVASRFQKHRVSAVLEVNQE